MKKLIITIAALVIVFTCTVSVMAAGEFATSADLFQYWEETTYPDYVCGVWSNDGTMNSLTIAVQENDAGNAGKQEILELIADDSTVTFAYQQYSLNYLRKVQEELDTYFEKDLGLASTGVNVYTNKVDVGVLEEKANNPETIAMIEEISSKYGDLVFIECTYAVVSVEDTVADLYTVGYNENEGNNNYIIVIVGIVGTVLAAVALTFAIRKKNALTLQTNTGETLSASASLSIKEVETMVKSSNAEVTPDLDSKIMNIIENR